MKEVIAMQESPSRQLVWRQVLDGSSMEHFRLSKARSCWLLHGRVVAAEDYAPLHVEYRIECNEQWLTQSCVIEQDFDGMQRQLTLARADDGWRIDGSHVPALRSCTDVDLGISPSTNTLPINRLGLAVGQESNIKAAWVKFPSLEVVTADQGYERLADHRYLYRNIGSEFRAELEVDDSGLMIDYEGI